MPVEDRNCASRSEMRGRGGKEESEEGGLGVENGEGRSVSMFEGGGGSFEQRNAYPPNVRGDF